MISFHIEPEVSGLALALVEAHDIQLGPADASINEYHGPLFERVRQEGPDGGEGRRTAVRSLLRRGGYRPAGRNKPAQEYLLRTLLDEGTLPAILNAVDVLNGVSVVTGLPISLIALDRVGTSLSLRLGRTGERFVFNRAGQELDLEGLLCVCQVDGSSTQPVGTPVKDSMLGKVTLADHHLLACIYAPLEAVTAPQLRQVAEQLATGFTRFCGASSAEVGLLPTEW